MTDRVLLRYPGGKARIAPWVLPFFGPHEVYVEAYGGGASVLLNKVRSAHEVYNDIDSDVVNLFRVLRDKRKAAELLRLLKLTPFAREEFATCIGSMDTLDLVERARILVVKSIQGFGSHGLQPHATAAWRKPRMGKHDEFESYAKDWHGYVVALDQIIERLRGVTIENGEALDVIRDCDGPRTLHYLDPPYITARVPGTGDPYTHPMTTEDHERLLDTIVGLRGMVAISGYGSELYDRALADWTKVTRPNQTSTHGERTECLWLCPNLRAKTRRRWT